MSLPGTKATNTNTFVDMFMMYRNTKFVRTKQNGTKWQHWMLYFLPLDSMELGRLRRLGTRRFLSRSRDLEDSDPDVEEPDDESESDEEDESLSLLLPLPDELDVSESESDVDRLRLLRFLLCESSFSFSLPLPLPSFSRSFSFASRILFAVPIGFLNSSGTSTEGLPSAFNLASTFGFSSCSVRDGRVRYGLGFLHS